MDAVISLSFIIIFLYYSFKTVSLHFTDKVGIQVSLRILHRITFKVYTISSVNIMKDLLTHRSLLSG
jgi:hypothetical protein